MKATKKGIEKKVSILEDNPLWYKDAIIYELHVRAFRDSNGDGIGDFKGLKESIGYLQDLGVTAIWLLPFYPSPLRDDGYDIADYKSVNPIYGTLKDFKDFLTEAHSRNIRVITELVVNHTSDQHPWFQRARKAPAGHPHRDFYVWNDTPEKYTDTRIIFKDFETSNWTWDPVAKAYYWHRFYSHQPDLNFDNPEVKKAIEGVMDFWMDMGVDGMRLDAVPYIFEREGTNCENLPETHEYLKELRTYVDKNYKNKMLLAEANQWPEDSVAYFGGGDECNMAFHFPLMPRMFMSIRMEDNYPIIDILEQTPAIPDSCQWAIFLRNHDELTLEMVTDEERDYMYRTYANEPRTRINLGIRRRLAPLLDNDRKKIELMNALLFSLPGTPVIYYGDEIGMGDNIYLGDRDGVRTPIQWSGDKNAGFSKANPQKLYMPISIDPEYHYEAINIEAQQNNPSSLLWWMKQVIRLRKQFPAFNRGNIRFLYPENRRILAFIRKYEDEQILVVANLARKVEFVELDLEEYAGMVPIELFGQTEFPVIQKNPYFLTLSSYTFYWFLLKPKEVLAPSQPSNMEIPVLDGVNTIEQLFQTKIKLYFETKVLPNYMRRCRWFAGKARKIKSVSVADFLKLDNKEFYLLFLNVNYVEGEDEVYSLPLSIASREKSKQLREEYQHLIIAYLGKKEDANDLILYDGLGNENLQKLFLNSIITKKGFRGEAGEINARTERGFIKNPNTNSLTPKLLKAEQSNSSIIFDDVYMLKLFRRLDKGINPDLEIGKFLAEKANFQHVPPLCGSLDYTDKSGSNFTIGILTGFVPNFGDAWKYTLEAVSRFYENVQLLSNEREKLVELSEKHLVYMTDAELSDELKDTIGPYLSSAELLGVRTAEMHIALSSDPEDPSFSHDPFSTLYVRSLYQSMRSMADQSISLLKKSLKNLSNFSLPSAERVIKNESQIKSKFQSIVGKKMDSVRIRIHGDYHLGQVLFTGKDFVILDFEGEPLRSISERKLKRSVLRDVAGMLRSFHYASVAVLFEKAHLGETFLEDLKWARLWYRSVSIYFLKGYLSTANKVPFLPSTKEGIANLLDIYLLEKAMYELKYELAQRPDWVRIPIQGILDLIDD
ncbi:MAG: maltose alpha-D-glucosyltransferase [Leptospiraceae bacterium]|nr:maltose alpha-D-glucosyltransferase [Leptospiraceae bacterium]